MSGSLVGRRVCGGIRRKSTLGPRFKLERKKAAAVLKGYIEEEEEEKDEEESIEEEKEVGEAKEKRGVGKGDEGRAAVEEDDDDEDGGDWCESTSSLYRSSHLDVSSAYLERPRPSYGGWRVSVGRSKEGEERRSSAFLARRESSLTTCQHAHDDQASSEPAELVKVILLGAPAVGKTSIVRQFVLNEFCDDYYPTDRRHTYYPSVVINKKLYDLKISDLPPIPYFPVDSLLEWTDFRAYGLRSATAYVLVFDLSNAADTFRHIKCLREQMAGSRDMRNVPVVVVGNKHDRIRGPARVPEGDHALDEVSDQPPLRSSYGGSCSFLSPPSITLLPSLGSSTRSLLAHQHHQHQQQQKAIALSESRERRDIANIVQKHWRCGYVECSAKYNWRVVAVFKELMQAVDAIDGKEVPEDDGEDGLPPAAGSQSEEAGKETVARYHVQRHHGTSIVVESFPRDLERKKCSVL